MTKNLCPSPDEISFNVEETTWVKITPSFNLAKIELMAETIGPFRAGRPIKVPLWLALFLNSSQACKLVPPKWLTVKSLKKFVAAEKGDKTNLSKVPPHYMELSNAYFTNDPKSVDNIDQVRSLVEDLRLIRLEKLRKIVVTEVSNNSDFCQFRNATQMEIHMFRETVHGIMDLFAQSKQVYE